MRSDDERKPANKKSRGEMKKEQKTICPIKGYNKQANKRLLIGK